MKEICFASQYISQYNNLFNNYVCFARALFALRTEKSYYTLVFLRKCHLFSMVMISNKLVYYFQRAVNYTGVNYIFTRVADTGNDYAP